MKDATPFLLLVGVIILILLFAGVMTVTGGGCDNGHGLLFEVGKAYTCVGVGWDRVP